MEIKWLGHSSFRINLIYLDPYQIHETEKASLILITHSHYDHFSQKDMNKIQSKDTIIITPEDIKIPSIKLKPFQETIQKGIKIQTIPSYNINKKFHPKENNWLSYILEIENKRILFCGDTDLIPEFNQLNDIHIAFLPIGGTYTMNVVEAVEAVKIIKPKITIPMHYGKIVGFKEDALKFKKSLLGFEVIVLEENQIVEL